MTGWVRSTFCAAGDCVEVKFFTDGSVGIRESVDRLQIGLTAEQWRAFTAGVKNGDFDHLEETS